MIDEYKVKPGKVKGMESLKEFVNLETHLET